jgi:hypothetical protein
LQLRREYWLGRRREDISSQSPGSEDDTEDIEEFPLLLPSGDVRALIEAARLQGLTAPGLARRLIADYLQSAAGVPDEAETVCLLLEHLAANGRARSGGADTPGQMTFRKP